MSLVLGMPFRVNPAQRLVTEMERVRDLPGETPARWSQWLLSTRQQDRRGLRRYIGPKRLVGAAGLTAIIIGTWYLRTHGVLDPGLIETFVRAYPISTPVVTILVYSLGVLSGLPTLPFNLVAGMLWGSILGGVISATGATIGAALAFAAARFIFGRPLANHFDNKLVAQFQREFEDNGWRFLAFIRLSPALPTGPLNYILGLTGIDTFTYLWSTFAFLLPPSIAVAFIGNRLGEFIIEGETASTIKLLLAVSGGATILAALAYAAHLFRLLRRAKSNSI